MNYFDIIFIALALAMDAFAVSIAGGSFFGKATARQKFRLSFHFGLFQFFMPIIGWFAGAGFVEITKNYDHWIAMLILLAIGIKMIYDSLKGEGEIIAKDISKGMTLMTLAFATSIDALAVGFSFGIMNNEIILPSIIIGITASSMSLIGIKIGEVMSAKFGKKIGIAGGIILIILGIEILLEHLLAK